MRPVLHPLGEIDCRVAGVTESPSRAWSPWPPRTTSPTAHRRAGARLGSGRCPRVPQGGDARSGGPVTAVTDLREGPAYGYAKSTRRGWSSCSSIPTRPAYSGVIPPCTALMAVTSRGRPQPPSAFFCPRPYPCHPDRVPPRRRAGAPPEGSRRPTWLSPRNLHSVVGFMCFGGFAIRHKPTRDSVLRHPQPLGNLGLGENGNAGRPSRPHSHESGCAGLLESPILNARQRAASMAAVSPCSFTRTVGR